MFKKILLIFTAIFLLSTTVFSYDNLMIHPEMAWAAAKIYNDQASNKLTDEQIKWLVEGAIDEDAIPRYLNHYYDPKNQTGLNSDDVVSGKVVHFTGISAKEWANNQSNVIGLSGDYSINATLNNYRQGNLERAYQGIGHILHLIQDMAVPAHTRNDSHAGGDPFENWAQINGKINLSRESLIKVDDPDNAFHDLATYSNDNFFSKDTIKNVASKIIKKVTLQINNEPHTYVYCKDNYGNEFICLREIATPAVTYYLIDEFKIHLNYWNLLYPKAVGYSAGVIDYFVKEFEKIDAEKTTQAQLSFWQKTRFSLNSLFNDIRYSVGDVLSAAEIFRQNTNSSLSGLASGIKQEASFVGQAGQEVIQQSAASLTKTTSALGEKIVTGITNPITASDLLKPKPVGASASAKPPAEKVVVLGVENNPTEATTRTNPLVQSPAETGQTGVLYGQPFALLGGDSLPPETTIVSAPATLSSSTAASFVFASTEAGERFEFNLDNGGWNPSASALNLAALNDGNHRLEARAIDNANNIDPTPAVADWTIDTITPTVTVALGPASTTASTTAYFEFSASESLVNYYCRLDTGEWQSCSATTIYENLIEGERELAVRASDLAGNTGSSTSYYWKIDLTPPPPLNQANHIVISELQLNDNEFVELYNPTDIEIPLAGWHFSYFSSTRADWSNPYRDQEFLTEAVITPHRYYLIGLKGYATSSGPVKADWQPYSTAQLSNTAGTVAIFNGAPATSTLIDALGWGDTILREGEAAPAPAVNQSLERKAVAVSTVESMSSGGGDYLAGNSFDSDNNVSDFILRPASEPQNFRFPIEPRVLSAPQISVDSVSGAATWSNTVTWPHTVSGGDRCLFVLAHWKANNYTVNSITYGGQDLSGATGGAIGTAIWYLTNPELGPHEITVQMGGSSNLFDIFFSAISLNGCDTNQPIDSVVLPRPAQSVIIADTITTFSDNAFLVDAVSAQVGTIDLAPGAGQTAFYLNKTNSYMHILSVGDSYKQAGPAGIYNMQWDQQINNGWSHSIVAVRGK